MKILLISAAMALGPAGFAAACPYIAEGAESHDLSAGELAEGVVLEVVAGGPYRAEDCVQTRTDPARGYVAGRPDFSLHMPPLEGRRLAISTRAGCDTTLLVNTGGVNWYADDDDGGGSNALISLTRPSDGRYDVWVGTYDSGLCPAQLIVRFY
ncbi:hypothetical protein BCF33_1008 [Hasllibacter halocynthiae]|uniref:Uncharacterized protein n=1 Tax=Hasllibacter halocynthiae TaxID=595589 RepID=A0A2T0X8W6_9RHOB|nr:hypothetical protein [Hasllibacter halocynthiae]PRY95390.1 hypothetical protein BCF33_1008 [Hasllibacter halocynthiae]